MGMARSTRTSGWWPSATVLSLRSKRINRRWLVPLAQWWPSATVQRCSLRSPAFFFKDKEVGGTPRPWVGTPKGAGPPRSGTGKCARALPHRCSARPPSGGWSLRCASLHSPYPRFTRPPSREVLSLSWPLPRFARPPLKGRYSRSLYLRRWTAPVWSLHHPCRVQGLGLTAPQQNSVGRRRQDPGRGSIVPLTVATV